MAVQKFIADDWPARLWFRFVPLAVPVAICWYTDPLTWIISHWLNAVLFAVLLALAWCLGWIAAIIPGLLVLGPLYHSQGLLNGAPYRVGDTVRVLARRQRGRVARVYEVWPERDQVRLSLGEEASQHVEDMFSYFEICRVTDPPEPNPAALAE